MKKVLAEEQIKLEVATLETSKMLESLEVSAAEAKRESDKVGTIKNKVYIYLHICIYVSIYVNIQIRIATRVL